jgi:hypothetical protein
MGSSARLADEARVMRPARLATLLTAAVLLAGCSQSVVVPDYVGDRLDNVSAELPPRVDTTIVVDLGSSVLPSDMEYTGADEDQWTVVAQCSSGTGWRAGRPLVVGVLPTTYLSEQISDRARRGEYRRFLECETNERQPPVR